jgi:hypothetical protein
MDESVPLDLPEDVRTDLDAMSPERRHACIEQLYALHGAQVRFNENMVLMAAMLDENVDLFRGALVGRLEDQPERFQTEFLDYLMAHRMRAEWMRASARGDTEAAEEYLAKAEEYEERSKDFTPRLAAE